MDKIMNVRERIINLANQGVPGVRIAMILAKEGRDFFLTVQSFQELGYLCVVVPGEDMGSGPEELVLSDKSMEVFSRGMHLLNFSNIIKGLPSMTWDPRLYPVI